MNQPGRHARDLGGYTAQAPLGTGLLRTEWIYIGSEKGAPIADAVGYSASST
jgi:hypothetical protein